MTQFILRNNLNVMALLGAGVAAYLAIFWPDMPVMQRMVGLFFVALVLHGWEEMRYPGGFPEMMMSRLNFAIPNLHSAHAIVAGYVLYLVFVPLFFPHVVWLAMASMLLGVLEAVAHTAEIKLFRCKHFYSPGLATAIVLLLPISIFGITYAVRHDLMRLSEWAYSVLYMVVGFAIAQGTVVRMSGLKYTEFLKRVRSVLFAKHALIARSERRRRCNGRGFDLHWPWLGLGLSAVLLLLLFGTNVLRGNESISRWRDPVWLAWLAPAAYMIHQFEEYGIDAHGTRFPFPGLLSASVGMPPYPDSPLPEGLFIAINIPAIWIAGLVCGFLSRRHPFVGLGLYAIHFVNSLSHLGVALSSGAYNPGVLTSAVISLPLSLWVANACFIQGSMRRRGMMVLILAGTLFSVVLLGSIKLFAKGYLSATTLEIIQVLNPLCVILIPWLFEKSVLRQGRAAEAGPAISA